MKVLTKSLILDWIPAHTYTKTQLTACQHIHLCRLFRDQNSLALWQNDHTCYQFKLCKCRKIAKKHKWLMEQVFLCVAFPPWTICRVSPQYMVIHQQMLIAQALHRLRILA